MASTWISGTFPRFEQAIRKLTEQHRALKDEPLHLAVIYGPVRDERDIYLLEVIGHGAGAGITPDRELFETTFAPTAGFPMEPDQRLHLILSNPQEFEAAVQDHWPSAAAILSAIRAGDYQVLHADKVGKGLLKSVASVPNRKNGAARG